VLLRIIAPHFVAGIEPGVIAAPIIFYMLNWTPGQIKAYCAKKRWSVQYVHPFIGELL
jgi:hypothetical protein